MNKIIRSIKKFDKLMYAVIFILLFFMASHSLKFTTVGFILSLPRFFRFIFTEFLPPNFVVMPKFVRPIIDTFFAAIFATVIASVIAVILAFLTGRSTAPNQAVSTVIRAFLSLFRNVPVLVWAALLVIIFGIGTTAGIIALVIFTSAFLTRALADEIDRVDKGVIEAVNSVGATRTQMIIHGMIPSLTPNFISWILFLFEINIRASTILGLVGAGGLGYELKQSLDLFQYNTTSSLVIVIIVMLLTIEKVTSKIRSVLL